MEETIAAISTPFGEGAIALLRVSGEDAYQVVNRCLPKPLDPEAAGQRVVTHFQDLNRERLDQVVISAQRAPSTYTGEDLVEISCHGGILVTRRILETLLAAGARSARPGEFTERAFLNGKMDLTQAEAVMDLIRAQSDLALRSAREQLAGGVGKRVEQLRLEVVGILSHVEAYIDFPEEDIEPQTGETLLTGCRSVEDQLDQLLSTAERGRILRHGLRTVICGAPNAGKSSLLNFLLGYERAIVSDTPGTTRDSLEESIMLGGVPLRLSDTAGLRNSGEDLEKAGMARTELLLQEADLILLVVDASAPRPEDFQFHELLERPHLLTILNKSDLPRHHDWEKIDGVSFSCKTGAGRDTLEKEIIQRIESGLSGTGPGDMVAINERHQTSLKTARTALREAMNALQSGLPPELVAEELRAALDALAGVVGKTDVEEILDNIFSTFCIGK